MLQIVIWMLCVYFVLKGIEIWLIARTTPDERRGKSMVVALIALLIAIAAAGFFFFLSVVQSTQMAAPDPYSPPYRDY